MSRPAEITHGFGVFPYRGLALVNGAGARVETRQGDVLIDAGGASYGTANVGHGHPRVEAAIQEAAKGLTHASQSFAHPARSRLATRLLANVGAWAGRVFFTNSGTESVETALKVAMHETGRSRVVAFEEAFHGRTLGALAATYRERYRAPFQDRLGPTTFVPYGDADALEAALGDDVAALLVEPIQGEAGVQVPPAGFVAKTVRLAREAGALSIVDEVQTGLGRTGSWLALHQEAVEPDLVCLAKSLAAGLPLGATIAHRDVAPLGQGLHGSTFGGSPVACRAALAVLDVLDEERLPERAQAQGARLIAGLRGLEDPLVREVRGRGLMVGLGLGVRATPVLQALQTEGVLALPGADGIRLLPPLVLDAETTDRIVAAVGDALEATRARYAKEADA